MVKQAVPGPLRARARGRGAARSARTPRSAARPRARALRPGRGPACVPPARRCAGRDAVGAPARPRRPRASVARWRRCMRCRRVGARHGGRVWGLSLPEPESSTSLAERRRARPAGPHPGQPGALRAAAPLRGAVPSDAFTHGDMRWDNCLLAAPRRAGGALLLIDWETRAGRRPGRSSARSGGLPAAVDRAVPVADRGRPAGLADHARHPLERVQPAMDALWEAYRRASADRALRV